MFNIPFVRVQMDHKSDFEVIPALLLLLFLLFLVLRVVLQLRRFRRE